MRRAPSPGPGLPLSPAALRDLAVVALSWALLAAANVLAVRPTLRPDVAAILVLHLALERSAAGGLALTLVIGYLADVLSGEPRGLVTAALVLLFLALRVMVLRVMGSSLALVAALGALASLTSLLLRLAIEATLGSDRATWSGLAPALPAILLGGAVLAPPVHRVLAAIEARAGAREPPPMLRPNRG
jgi:cell shape-determining protein MreD